MNWNILVCAVIAILMVPVSTVDPKLNKLIGRIYNDTYNYQELVRVYNIYKYPAPKGKLHPCISMHERYKAFQGQIAWKLIIHEIIIDETGIPFTLDGHNYMRTPALIKCHVDNANALVFYVLLDANSFIDLSNGYGVQYSIIYEYGSFENRSAFATVEVLSTSILKEAFQKQKEEKNLVMYKQMKKEGMATKICNEHVRKYILPRPTIKAGTINAGDLTLLLAGAERVDIPGVLVCKFDTSYTQNHNMHFVIHEIGDHANTVNYLTRDIDQYGRLIHQVYDTNGPKDGKWAYALEKYLIKNNSETALRLLD